MDRNRNNKITVLVVDDSALMSRQIAGILNDDHRLEVVGRARDGLEALEMVGALNPDVITLDVEMPRMNGITVLKHIMVRHATPTVMISALTTEGAKTTFDALKFGAIDVIAKPSRREDESLEAQKADIIAKVRRAASIRSGRSRYIRMRGANKLPRKASVDPPDEKTKFIGIGAGTGGYYGLLRIVPALDPEFPDVLVAVLLVSKRYVPPFISYLESHSAVPVTGIDGVDVPKKGTCYICSGQDGLVVERNAQGFVTFRVQESHSNEQGAIDKMLASLSVLGSRSVGILMTGAGSDGAEGMAEIRRAGGLSVVQDVNNCLDPHMPLAALEKDAAQKILPDYKIADFLMRLRESKDFN